MILGYFKIKSPKETTGTDKRRQILIDRVIRI